MGGGGRGARPLAKPTLRRRQQGPCVRVCAAQDATVGGLRPRFTAVLAARGLLDELCNPTDARQRRGLKKLVANLAKCWVEKILFRCSAHGDLEWACPCLVMQLAQLAMQRAQLAGWAAEGGQGMQGVGQATIPLNPKP